MPGVYLIDPQRYMTRELCAISGIRLVFTMVDPQYQIDLVKWARNMHTFRAVKKGEPRIVGYRDIPARLVNIPFKESLWSIHRPNHDYYYDPETLSEPGYLMLPSGNQFKQPGGMGWLPWRSQLPPRLASASHQLHQQTPAKFRLRFNAYSVMLAEQYLDLDIIEEFSDTFDLGHLKRSGLSKITKMPKDLSEFARLFGSADGKDVLAGTRMLVQRNAQRLETAIEREEKEGEYSPSVTILANQVFTQGVTLAKMMDPSLRAGPKVAVQVSSNGKSSVTIEGGSGSETAISMAQALKELQDEGIPLRQITDEIMVSYMAAKASGDPKQILAVLDDGSPDNSGRGLASNTIDAEQNLPF